MLSDRNFKNLEHVAAVKREKSFRPGKSSITQLELKKKFCISSLARWSCFLNEFAVEATNKSNSFPRDYNRSGTHYAVE